MFDIRPIGYVIGIIVAFLGVMMIFPMILDFADGNPHWRVFAQAGAITTLSGLFVSMSCSNGKSQGLELQKTFLLTTGVWVVLPIFAALPFLMGATQSSVFDAVFEATSGLTTTGSTVISGLDDLPRGLLLWRGLLNWLGGIGIIVVAMVFLPELRVGGMQIFRAESFDTMGKILPRATQISGQISIIYIGLTIACFLSYIIADMSGFDALIHALTTVATGGFSSHDASFAAMSGPAEYVASLYMVLAALPFVRFVQLLNGSARPIFTDEQIRGFVATLAVIIAFSTVYLIYAQNFVIEQAFRQALFNIISIMSGTGYASADYMLWGAPMVAVFFFIGLIGGCAGSTACSVKIFRYQIMLSAMSTQLRRIQSPNSVHVPHFQDRPISQDVMDSVMVFFVMFFISLGALAFLLGLTGLDFITALSGAATAIGNIGPGLGPEIGPTGNFENLNSAAKGLLIFGMILGRLELMAVFVLFTRRFWQAA
ncbi:TrkH family potassium uptake protein [Paracoccaceae bacterium]|nr:TrkH family potassium uptake protein [Paracoccaceae bacterium]